MANRRKRPRETTNQYGIDLPEIPGVPMAVIPLQIHALQTTTKFFHKDATDIAVGLQDDNPAVTEAAASSGTQTNPGDDADDPQQNVSVMEAILNRMDETSTTNTAEQQPRRLRQTRKQEAITSWLSALHRAIKDERKEQIKQAIVVSALSHVWEIQQTHSRVTVRRAALHCAGHLLLKSADARRWLLDEDSSRLTEWFQELATFKKDDNRVCLWQREAGGLLQTLDQDGYSDVYPTVTVGLERLRQVCPEEFAMDDHGESTNVHSNMADWRHQRDMALQYAQEEDARVTKLLQRAQACLDVLVPRMTSSNGNDERKPKAISSENEKDSEEEEDDGDIDWEDGWENEDASSMNNDTASRPQEESHTAAVERTLAVMETTAGLRGGQLEIDFAPQQQECDDEDKTMDPQKVLARQRLEKCVRLLRDRHMPRLTLWVQGLTRADGLKEVQVDGVSSGFVALPQERARRRKPIFERLLELKGSVASLLQSAQRLGVLEATTTTDETATRQDRMTHHALHLLGTSARHESLTSSLTRRRAASARADISHRRSNRIQIKYRKS